MENNFITYGMSRREHSHKKMVKTGERKERSLDVFVLKIHKQRKHR